MSDHVRFVAVQANNGVHSILDKTTKLLAPYSSDTYSARQRDRGLEELRNGTMIPEDFYWVDDHDNPEDS